LTVKGGQIKGEGKKKKAMEKFWKRNNQEKRKGRRGGQEKEGMGVKEKTKT